MAKKTTEKTEASKCPVTMEQFTKSAKPLRVSIDGRDLLATVKAPFSSGSYGWFAGEKVTMDVDGTPCKTQVTLSIVLVGSKPAEAK